MFDLSRRQIISGVGAASLAPTITLSAMTSEASMTATKVSNQYTASDTRHFHTGPMGSIYKVPANRMRYIYRNMGEFLPHREVGRGGGMPSLLKSAPDEALARFPLQTAVGTLSLAEFCQHPGSYIDGLIVSRGNRILFEQYPRMQSDDRHILWSVTKVLVGHAIALLCDVGKINPQSPIDQYIPALKNSGWSGVSVRDILDQASGIDAEEGHPDAFTDPNQIYYQFEASIGYLPIRIDNRSTYEIVASLKKKDPPGTKYEYTSVNAFALAWLVEEVSGQTMASFFSEHIWKRIGADRDAIWSISPKGAPGADGGFSCTLRDLLRYGLQYVAKPLRGSQKTVSARHMVNLATSGRISVFRANDKVDVKEKDLPLFNCWQWDSVWSDGMMHKAGWGGQGLLVAPHTSVVMAWFGTPPDDTTANELESHMRSIVKSVVRNAE
jgi:CubicO group peptidase (beta-lactamase class C family)